MLRIIAMRRRYDGTFFNEHFLVWIAMQLLACISARWDTLNLLLPPEHLYESTGKRASYGAGDHFFFHRELSTLVISDSSRPACMTA
jgi:hypothetical protein